MGSQLRKSSGNKYYQEAFAAALYEVFRKTRQMDHDIVCMACRKFTLAGDLTDECCRKLGFPVDRDLVVTDVATGLVTHAYPCSKNGDIEK